jgi:type 1 glutamine amidotransferase
LILSGGGSHDWRTSTPILRRILAETGRFDVRVCESPAGLTARTLEDFDVLVDDGGPGATGDETGRVIGAFVELGKGLVVTHGALAPFVEMRMQSGGKPPAHSEQDRKVERYRPVLPGSGLHVATHFLRVKIGEPQQPIVVPIVGKTLRVGVRRREHPIVRGMNGKFAIADAPYRNITVHPQAEVLATADDGAVGGSAGNGAPVLVACSIGKGRVVCTTLGHDAAAMQEKVFVATLRRGVEWAATGAVTLPTDLGPARSGAAAGAVRALLITGGHDHEASFYGLFDDHKDLAPVPVASSSTAFQGDLRAKYDVVVMYDFSRDLDATGKKNLRDFVEGGKGIVVLHHALLDYPQWPWWSESVVGGRYRLKPEGNVPASTFKGDQQIFVTPAEPHEVTAGIAPFHITDETYKMMWFSPRVRPLLATDNQNSDRTLAWIGPDEHYKVVAIQLGHGRTAFGHPSYRALVRNAILWAAGRTK